MSLFFVYLRRPAGNADRRNDPFWEFGSFGTTGCHCRNLLHPNHSPIELGDRLAFLQGWNGEVRLVGVTPRICAIGDVPLGREVRWDPNYRPVRYSQAPILIRNDDRTDFPEIRPFLDGVNRPTPCSRMASRFRARTRPIEAGLAEQILHWSEASELPPIQCYPEEIVPCDGKWYQTAMENGWAVEERRLQFERLRCER